ncbi:MAG: hypothetical protein Q7J24_06020 [Desulfomicrobium sp.]|nr:hypothetical protein [Desulfomicrobium sp.]
MASTAKIYAPSVADQNQEALDQLLEVGQRIRLIGKMLWHADDADLINRADLGTVAIMLQEQSDNLSATLAALALRLSEVEHG